MINIPPTSDGASPPFPLIVASILETDQFDDWLPDPLYFEDQRLDAGAVASRIGARWTSGQIDERDRIVVDVPREGGGTLLAIALGLDLRIVTQAVIAGMAQSIRAALLRDKVGGFDFTPGATPIFSIPGQGMAALADVIVEAALLQTGQIYIADIVDFSNTAKFAGLASELTRAGARIDQAKFIRAVAFNPADGLPSIDDSFAFIYNYYLAPIDQALAAAQVNFFRYRDEYFAVSERDAATIRATLQAKGLNVRQGLTTLALPSESDLQVPWFEQPEIDEDGNREDLSETIGRMGDFLLTAEFRCTHMDERDSGGQTMCQSDAFELRFTAAPFATWDRFWSGCKAGVLRDGVDAAPVLRDLHVQRKSGVLHRPPLDDAPAPVRRFRDRLKPFRTCLTEALAAAVAKRSAWQAAWAAPLLADLGPLTVGEVELMRQGLAANLGPAGDLPLRLALARSSDAPASAVWRAPTAQSSSHERRCLAVTAQFLARRGATQPWQQVRPALSDNYGNLARFLDGFI